VYTDFKGGNGRRRAAGAAAETRGRKARCDPVRWIEQPSKHWCACRGDPAAGPFDFSVVHAAHRAMHMRTRACTRMAAQMTRPALGSTPGRCVRQPRCFSGGARMQCITVHAALVQSTRMRARACTRIAAQMTRPALASQHTPGRCRARPPPRHRALPGIPAPRPSCFHGVLWKAVPLGRRPGMSWCSKIKIVGFFPPGTVNTLFSWTFPEISVKKSPRRPCLVVLPCLQLRKRVSSLSTEAMFRGSCLFGTPKTCSSLSPGSKK
jgi:hypothetical protein